MNVFEDFIAPIILLLLALVAFSWMVDWVSKAGQPDRRFMSVVLTAASVPSILRVGCLWCIFAGVFQNRSGIWDFLVMMIAFYPEGVLLPEGLVTSPKDGRLTVPGTLLLSLILTFSVLVCAVVGAAIVSATKGARRRDVESGGKHDE